MTAAFDKIQRHGIIKTPTREGRPKGRCYIERRLATSLRREVMLMGNGRWVKALRFLVWFVIVLALMLITAQKAY